MPHLIFCSLDSLVGAFALQFYSSGRLSRARIVAAFGLCDLLAAMAGALLFVSGHPLGAEYADSSVIRTVLFTIPIAVIVAANRYRKVLWLLPVIFCLDNLFYGWAGYFPGAFPCLSSGCISALFADCGILFTSIVTSQTVRFRRVTNVALALAVALLAAN